MKKYLFIALFVSTVSISFAQSKGEAYMGIQYAYGFPMGSFKSEIVDKASPRGLSGDLLFSITDNIGVGLGIGYQDFLQKYPRQVYHTNDGSDISAVLSNSVTVMPLMAKGQYLFGNMNRKAAVYPYVSLAVGAGFVNYKQYLGGYGGAENTVHFVAQGGAGVLVPFSSSFGLKAGGNYNYIPYNRNGSSNLDYWTGNIGVYLNVR